jgi:hypothetical protein
VDEDEVGAVERLAEVGGGARVGLGREAGVGPPPAEEPGLAVVADEVLAAPAGRGLERPDLVAAGQQLARDAAQEVGVAVVPAGLERVAEQDDPHAAAATGAARAPSPAIAGEGARTPPPTSSA